MELDDSIIALSPPSTSPAKSALLTATKQQRKPPQASASATPPRRSLTADFTKKTEQTAPDATDVDEALSETANDMKELSLLFQFFKRKHFEIDNYISDDNFSGFGLKNSKKMAEPLTRKSVRSSSGSGSNSGTPKVKRHAKTEDKKAVQEQNQQANGTPKAHIVGDEQLSSRKEKHIADVKAEKPINEIYLKPFKYGWKRELVWRTMVDNKARADVYFYAPSGKKLRTRTELIPWLHDDLTIDNFSFVRETLGVGDEYETVRHAKTVQRALSLPAAATSTQPINAVTGMGKRISKPKGPKGASPPPEGWTATRALKVNNAALLNSSGGGGGGGSGSGSGSGSRHAHASVNSNSHSSPNFGSNSSNHRYSSASANNIAGGGGSSSSSRQQKNNKRYYKDLHNEVQRSNEVIKKKRMKLAESSRRPISNDDLIGNSAGQQNSELLANSLSAGKSSNAYAISPADYFGHAASSYKILVHVFEYLNIQERSVAAKVCSLWHLASQHASLWTNVRMKNSKISNWELFANALQRGGTKHLDMRKILNTATQRADDMWLEFCKYIGTVSTLEAIDLCRCNWSVLESLFLSNANLQIINAVFINDDYINLNDVHKLSKLRELRLRCNDSCALKSQLLPLTQLSQLQHLSLTSVRQLEAADLSSLTEIKQLLSLELGECNFFDESFAENILSKLTQLQRLRMENGNNATVCALNILEAVAQLKNLTQLELANFDIKPQFDEKLKQCVNLTKLLLIPTYISQSATTNHIVLRAVLQMAQQLQVFTWVVTVELLRVTALYVDQCDSKRERPHFDECIPVLKPLPGSADYEEQMAQQQAEETAGTVNDQADDDNTLPQIEILPLVQVEYLLAEHMPNTKLSIIKVPYMSTQKQQLVE